MNFDQDTDALEFHAENMEENNSIRENVTPTQIMEREVIGTGSQQEVMTINVPNKWYNNHKWLICSKCRDQCRYNNSDNHICRITTCGRHQWS